jgi:hypothetical protein
MTARQLRELLVGAPDDAVLVVPAFDHRYRISRAEICTAILDEDRDLLEDHYPDEPTVGRDRRINVILVGG